MMSATVAGHNCELAGGDQLVEDLLYSAPAETGPFLQCRLVNDPLAALVGVAGHDQQDDESGTPLARVIEDGGEVLKPHE
jgi:hypothetical protein